MTLTAQTRGELDSLRAQWKPITLSVMVVFVLYALGQIFEPGWVTYFAAVPPELIVLTTSLVRASDIKPEDNALHWHARRFGFALLGFACVWLLAAPLGSEMDFPAWREVYFRWGVALAFLTTPGLRPWWRYVTGEYREGK